MKILQGIWDFLKSLVSTTQNNSAHQENSNYSSQRLQSGGIANTYTDNSKIEVHQHSNIFQNTQKNEREYVKQKFETAIEKCKTIDTQKIIELSDLTEEEVYNYIQHLEEIRDITIMKDGCGNWVQIEPRNALLRKRLGSKLDS